MIDIGTLKFDEKGMIPAVVVDTETKKVLTVAYMNEESLRISMEKGLTCFFSRSRQKLWLKGETSGNVQHIVSITADCDRDALVVEVRKEGPACHLGTDSCFNEVIFEGEEPPAFQYGDLMYHVMVMMIEMGISLEDIKKEMASRHVIDKKVKQEKMVK